MTGRTALYNVGGYISIKGCIDHGLFQSAISKVVSEHDAFRSVFYAEEGVPYQRFDNNSSHKTELLDFSLKASPAGSCMEWMTRESQTPVEIEQGELFKFTLLKAAEDHFFWHIKIHHLLADGWAISLLVQRVSDAYSSLERGEANEAKIFSYENFVVEDQQYLQSDSYRQDEQFWLGKFKEVPIPLDIPALNGISSTDPASRRRSIFVERDFYNQVNAFAKEHGVTTFHVFLGVLYTYFSQVSGQKDIVIGLPILNRGKAAYKQTIGLFASIIPLRLDVKEDVSFITLVKHIKDELKGCFKHLRYPINDLVQAIKLPAQGRSDLFEISLSYEKHDYSTRFNGYETESIALPHNHEKLPLAIYVREYRDDQDVKIDFDYNLGCWNEEYISLFISRFEHTLRNAIAEPLVPVSTIEIIPGTEKKLLESFNDTFLDFPASTIHGIFERKAHAGPGKTALLFGNESMTYWELNTKADMIASLLTQKGIAHGDIVAIMLERSFSMVTGILGILKAGAAYLPIDPNFPAERISFMLKDSGAKAVLVSSLPDGHAVPEDSGIVSASQTLKQVQGDSTLQVIDINTSYNTQHSQPGTLHSAPAPRSLVTPDSLAYIIYTSGSTGIPKGVMIKHANILNTLHSLQYKYPMNEGDTYLLKTTFCFDVSVAELFGWFIGEGRLAILNPGDEKEPAALVQAIEKHSVTHLNFVPSAFNMLVQSLRASGKKLSESLRYIFVAGEAIPKETIEDYHQSGNTAQLVNLYGPTEISIYATGFPLAGYVHSTVNVPIGRPFPNTRAYIVNSAGALMPVGFPGELCIAGNGVAPGYLNRPDLSAEKFTVLPGPGERVYRTGDLVRWLPGGAIEFLGRIDNQVKIRGYRIELGEIESQLLKIEGVHQALVIDREEEPSRGTKYLCAYLVGDHSLPLSAIRGQLTAALPDYMIPAHFVFVDQFPLNPNGKIDRKKLPAPHPKLSASQDVPVSLTEEHLSRLWKEVLNIPAAGTNDNFFELGGHSLKATQLIAAIYREMGVELRLREIFNHATIQRLAAHIDSKTKTEYISIRPLAKKPHHEVSHSQRRLWLSYQLDRTSVAYNLFGACELNTAVNQDALSKAFRTVAARHESLRTTFLNVEGEPRQLVHDSIDFEVVFTDLSDIKDGEQYINALAENEAKTPFDLEKGPLFTVSLLKVSAVRYVLLLKMHHIISDGWSIEILLREVLQYYMHFDKGAELELDEISIHYKDYAAWHNQYLAGERAQLHRAYWMNSLEAPLPVLNFPFDFARPAKKTYNGAIHNFSVPGTTAQLLKTIAQQQGASLYMSLMAGYTLLLYRYSGNEDIIVGSPVAGREYKELENQIGFFVNNLPLRSRIRPADSFSAIMLGMKQAVLNAYEHQVYPFDKIVEDLDIAVDRSRSPLFDVGFTWQNTEQQAWQEFAEFFGLRMLEASKAHNSSKYDLWMLGREEGGSLVFDLEYNTDLLKLSTVQLFAERFVSLLQQVCENPEIAASQVRLASASPESIVSSPSFEFDF